MVTSKVTWVVRINGDSTRCPPSVANLISAVLIANADASSIGILSDQRESKGLLLIANLELEFRITPIRISELKIPNRKFSTTLQPASRILPSFELQGSSVQSSWSPSGARLIEKARLRFHLSPLKIRQLQTYNRERMAISFFTDHESLATSHAANLNFYAPLLARRLPLTHHIDLPSTYGLAWRAREVRLEPRSVPG